MFFFMGTGINLLHIFYYIVRMPSKIPPIEKVYEWI